MLDNKHGVLECHNVTDHNVYPLGHMDPQNVVTACLPAGVPRHHASCDGGDGHTIYLQAFALQLARWSWQRRAGCQ